MATFASEWLDEINTRDEELNLLVRYARQQYHQDEALYKSLCRSNTVMLYAHFEGALKSAVKSLVNDINRHGGYNAASKAVQKIYLTNILGQQGKELDQQVSHERRQRLDSLVTPTQGFIIDRIDVWPSGKNPTSSIFARVCGEFGCGSIFHQLDQSVTETIMFSGSKNEKIQKVKELEDSFIAAFSNFPYTPDWSVIGRKNLETKSQATIFQAFLDNTMKPRHDIAHGSALGSPLNIDEIENAVIILKALKLIFYLAISTA
jgi:RiboL-PSP-HEPN